MERLRAYFDCKESGFGYLITKSILITLYEVCATWMNLLKAKKNVPSSIKLKLNDMLKQKLFM